MQTDTTRENPQGTLPQAADSNSDLSATAPGQLRVIKRNGTVVPYTCLLYTSPSPRDQRGSRMPSSA